MLKIKSVINKIKLQKCNRLADSLPAASGITTAKVLLLLLVLIFLVSGCTAGLNDLNEMEDNDSQAEDEGEDTAMEEQKDFSGFTTPPIDQNVPENLETATLGMG